MADPLPVMPGAANSMGNPFDSASSKAAVPSHASEPQPHMTEPASPSAEAAAATGTTGDGPAHVNPSSSSTTPSNAAASGAGETAAATPEHAAINDLLPELDPNDPELTIEEQCDYAGESRGFRYQFNCSCGSFSWKA